ncbi:MAG: hypothetical protein HRT58_14400 [Crocinitomicaceae bacterium]|nr:hypothetical protein [Flavobacteriales bacterium]NQZ36857.1 hypothetical protein [Crocinitomicaceae bacterium]
MKNILLILFCGLQSLAFGHDFFFAFAEIEYNDISQKIEGTVSVSSHDLERIFDKKNWSIDDLESKEENIENFTLISEWLLDQFKISSNAVSIDLSVIGCEIELNGMIHFYLESAPVELSNTLTIKFDLLMSNFPEQQNKLTFYYRDQTITKSFLQTAFVHEIRLENS